MADKKTQLAVIGGGPGGYTAAFFAADLGMEVTLIDPEKNPGGVCLYRGCIPSKALLHLSRLINEAREAHAWGITFDQPKIDLDRIRSWKQQVVDQLTAGLGQLGGKRKVNHIRGTAVFNDERTLSITDHNGTQSFLGFEHAIVATGSVPAGIPGFEQENERIWNSKTALDLPHLPNRLMVVGGGYIGLELGSVYAALGSEVSIVEMTPNLLPGVDRDLVRFVQKRLSNQFKEILLETTVTDAQIRENGIAVTLRSKDQEPRNLEFDTALVAVGRRPNCRQLNLDKAGIQTDERGFIRIDDQRRTASERIFAIGDAAGEPMLAHKAYHEARVAVEAIAGRKVVYQPAAVPAVVFCDPEIAWAGLTESQAKENGIEHEVARFPWGASGRAVTIGRPEGLTKLLIEPQSERILGAGLVGPGAGELIGEAVVAIEMAANVTDLSLSIHPHPTLSETLKEAAEVFHGVSTHYYRPKRQK
jgi:dihydrolipoamide dehydrogenase